LKKHKFILKKTQRAFVPIEWDENETVGDITKKIEAMSEEELGFSDPTYSLEFIVKEEGKVSKVIWESNS